MERLIKYAFQFIGVPYIWGGNSPSIGLDCSGLVQELLASENRDPPGDQTAQALHDHFTRMGSLLPLPQAGALLFFGKSPTQISHVAMAVNHMQMIESGGGDSTTTTKEIAARQGAMVRVRPISRRSDLIAILMPPY